jgi:hypothetical protein
MLNLPFDCAGSTGELVKWARDLRVQQIQEERDRESAYLYSIEDFNSMQREQAA